MVDEIAARCTEVESGARNVDKILTNTLLPEVSRRLLEALVVGERPETIRMAVGAAGAFEYHFDGKGPHQPATAAAP